MKLKIFISLLFTVVLVFSTSAQIRFQAKTIADSFASPSGLHAADIDQDGDLDILCASGDYGVYILENVDGSGDVWSSNRVDNTLETSLTVWADDLDGDGHKDILTGGWKTKEIIWYRNTGNSVDWEKNVITSTFPLPHELMACDIDLDGDFDILAAGAEDHEIAVFYNDNGDASSWTEQTVDNDFLGSRSVGAADFDNDGDIDLAGGSLNGHEVTIWRNNGGTPISWTEVTITNTFNGSHRVELHDMNQDGLIDIVGTCYMGSTIAWWENTGEISADWVQRDIDNALQGAVMGAVADFDLDGDMDIIGTAQPSNTVTYYECTDPVNLIWEKKILEDDLAGVWPVFIGDFDGDNDPDFTIGASDGNEIRIYENIQEGRLTRQMNLNMGKSKSGLFITPDIDVEMPLYLVLPYCGDAFAFTRLRDMLIPLIEEKPGVIMVPELENLGDPEYLLEDPSVISQIIEYAVQNLPINPDSIYLMGMECNGKSILDYAKNSVFSVLGLIPFNPRVPSVDAGDFGGFPDLPVCLCSGSDHSDRTIHESIVSEINETFGKAWLNTLEGTGDEVLVGGLVEQLINCINYIDTAQGGTSSARLLPEEYDFSVYPNPASREINVILPPDQMTRNISICDAYGRIIHSKNYNTYAGAIKVELDQNLYSPGIYFLRIKTDRKAQVKRFLVQH